MPERTKVCTKCGLPKQLAKFPRRKTAKDGRASACLACKKIYRDENRDRLRQHAREYHAANPELAIGRNKQLLYGMSLDDIEQMVKDQGGLCPLCELPLGDGKYDRSVDHNHKCCPGKKACPKCVRGITHRGCNSKLGTVERWADQGLLTLSDKLLAYVQRGLPCREMT